TAVHADQPRALIGPQPEARIRHAERAEDMVAEIALEILPARALDRLADPVDVDAVVPFGAGIEGERRRQRPILAADDAGNALQLLVADEIGVPDVVAEAGGMGDEVAER